MERDANKNRNPPDEIKEGDLVLLDRKGLNWAPDKNEDKKLNSSRIIKTLNSNN